MNASTIRNYEIKIRTNVNIHPTARDIEILQLVADGFLAKQIAGKLGITLRTVSWHMQKIYRSHCTTPSIGEAVAIGFRRGWIK